MTAALEHRGPDGGGVVSVGRAAIGMRRLRIRSELKEKLPFRLPDGAHAAFNGEIYSTAGVTPDGGPGEVEALRGSTYNVNGMYALALLDANGKIQLMRDPLGIKPLFMRKESIGISFASELPALLAEGEKISVDISALHEILAFGRTLDRRTLYYGIRELAPGETCEISEVGRDAVSMLPSSNAPAPSTPISDIILRESIREALSHTLVSDRPIGLALSGGLDSSILAHELRALGVRNLHTLSLSLPANGDGLSNLATLGLGKDPISASWRHKVIPLDAAGYFNQLWYCARRMGEPFRMSSLPLYFELGRAASSVGATVLLLGEGADEIFGGYESYRSVMENREDLTHTISDFYLGCNTGYYLGALLGATHLDVLEDGLRESIGPLIGQGLKQALLNIERRLSLEPLLRRADHALMASGVEGRTPFLHGQVPALGAALSDNNLWSTQITKIALRRSYRENLPDIFQQAPKRALRAPSQIWAAEGARWLSVFMNEGRGLLKYLELRHEGIAAVERGCREGDSSAIPVAVALLTTAACLADLAERGRLADPLLTYETLKVARSLQFFAAN